MGNKYDEMVAVNQAISEEKTRLALQVIQEMVQENAEITIKELQERTGLSRVFFYKNGKVRRALEKARQESDQVPAMKPQQVILNRAMEKQLQIMMRRMKQLQEENEALRVENMLWKATIENAKIGH